jgi:hypothetical protein
MKTQEPRRRKVAPAEESQPLLPAYQTRGVEQAFDNADDWWRSVALQGLTWLAELGQPFDAYDLTELGVPDPDHPDRWGALFQAAYKQGLVEPVGYHESRRPGRAGGVCRVWQGVR